MSDLLLIHVIFRHGNRTPDAGLYFPKQTPIKAEDYEPFGLGQLTEEGKTKMLDIGSKLKSRYKSFLGSNLNKGNIDAWSSNVQRTKASLLHVLNSLSAIETFEEPDLNYLPLQADKIFLASISSAYKSEFLDNFKSSNVGQDILNKYSDLLEYLKEYSGIEIDTTFGAYRVHDLLTTQRYLGIKLPEWTDRINWENFEKLVSTHYSKMMVETEKLKNYLSGQMLNKIITDSKNKIRNVKKTPIIHLYSGHDVNIAGILGILGLSYDHIPKFGACIIIEVHKEISIGNYYVKVFYCEDPKDEFAEKQLEKNSFEAFERYLSKEFLLE